ncbi:MAG: AGE family epimerase/isomerase [Armatimonadota bacterium]|jgi:N-acylglucosamine 2-epimerase
MGASEDLAALLRLYEGELLDNVAPWWMANGIDHRFGGPMETITEDGRVTSDLKPIWSVGRALFIWSRLYNRAGRRHEWLRVADRTFELIATVGPRVEWAWPQSIHRNGTPLAPSRDIYADGFVMMGLAEYIRAAGSERAIEAARQTRASVQRRMVPANAHLAGERDLGPDAACHGISMIFSLVYHQLGTALADAQILADAHEHALLVQDFYRDEHSGLVREYLNADGTPVDGPLADVCIAGHAVESAWFGLQIFRERNEPDRVARAVEAIRSHIEASWDDECGGFFGAIDVRTGQPTDPARNKNMWPHTEALYALLLAWSVTGEQWCLDWYDRVHDWTWAHFPNREHGEWHRQVTREGAYPWDLTGPGERPRKEPFHLPRTLILTVELLRALEARGWRPFDRRER